MPDSHKNKLLKKIRGLIEASGGPNRVSDYGESLLTSVLQEDPHVIVSLLAYNGSGLGDLARRFLCQDDIVRLLIDMGANVRVKNHGGQSPLHLALARSSCPPETIACLLAAGADPNAAAGNEERPLHYAARQNHLESVPLLIAAGGEVNARDNWNFTALHNAAAYGCEEIVRLLVDAGADVNAQSDTGWTPLHNAVSAELRNSAEWLIKAGAAIDLRNQSGQLPGEVHSQEDWSPWLQAVAERWRLSQPETAPEEEPTGRDPPLAL